MKEALGEAVKEVRVTFRLTDLPACIVADEHEISGHLARMLKAASQNVPDTKPILEINPRHALVQRLRNETDKFADWSHVLFDQQPNDFAGLLARYLNIERLALNGGKAARYRRVLEALVKEVVVLPSSSPANATHSFERKLAMWKHLLLPAW